MEIWSSGRVNTELLSDCREDGTIETGSSGEMDTCVADGLFLIWDPETMTGGSGRVVFAVVIRLGGLGWCMCCGSFLLVACCFWLLVPTQHSDKTNARAKRMGVEEGKRMF